MIEAVSDNELKQELEKGNWKISIVGDGPYKAFLENKVNQKGLNNIVTFEGWLDNNSKKIKDLYGKAKLFISASYFESFGLTLLESISAGCYPIVSSIEGYEEVLKDDKYFFSKGNINEIKEKIQKAITGKIGNISLNKEFYWSNILKQYEVILR